MPLTHPNEKKNNLTWRQWYTRAGLDYGDIQRLSMMQHEALYSAWRRGDEPSKRYLQTEFQSADSA